MKTMIYRDQIGVKLRLDGVPKRIISLVPSQTELLVYLGLERFIVGVTKFCVHPVELRKQKTVVGGTKNVHYDKIEQLNPDIILCNKEENTKEIVEKLREKFPVHVSDIYTIENALEMIQQYGEIFDQKKRATTLISRIKTEYEDFKVFIEDKPKKRVAYFIWKNPWMAVGANTFIDYLLRVNRFDNVFSEKERYPIVSEEELGAMEDLDLILLSSEPFPFSEKHIKEITRINPETKVMLVDGEYFSWYGSRLKDAFDYFRTLH